MKHLLTAMAVLAVSALSADFATAEKINLKGRHSEASIKQKCDAAGGLFVSSGGGKQKNYGCDSGKGQVWCDTKT